MGFSTKEFLLFTQELIHFTQEILPLLPKKLLTPYSRNLRVPSHRISGSLARSTRDLSPAAISRFPMVLGDTAGATYARIFSLDALWGATAAHTMQRSGSASALCGHPEPGLQVWECSTNHC